MMSEAGSGEGLPAAEVHDVLRNDRRRLVLERLGELDNSVSIRDLAEYVASAESGESPPPKKLRQSVYVSLHQTHLPKLDGLDVVRYDTDDKEVTLGSQAEEVTVYLEVVPQYGLSRSETYLALATLGGFFSVAAAVGVPGITLFDPGTWALVSLVGVGVVASFHTYKQNDLPIDRL